MTDIFLLGELFLQIHIVAIISFLQRGRQTVQQSSNEQSWSLNFGTIKLWSFFPQLWYRNLQLEPWWKVILFLLWDPANPASAVCVSMNVWVVIYTVTCPTAQIHHTAPIRLCVCVGAASHLATDMNAVCDCVCVEPHLQRSASFWQLHSQELALANVPSVLFEAYELGRMCPTDVFILFFCYIIHHGRESVSNPVYPKFFLSQ